MGVIGVYGVKDASQILYYGLHTLQHRGQEGAGIVTFDGEGKSWRHRSQGLVSEVFNTSVLSGLKGEIGIAAVKYANIAKGGTDNVQPLVFHHHSGDFAIAGDGNLVNADRVASYLETRGSLFQTSTDSELLAYLIKKEGNNPRIFKITNALNML